MKKAQSLRILHVMPNVAPAYGGPTEVLKGLAPAQSQSGNSVTICTTTSDYPNQRQTLSDRYFRDTFGPSVEIVAFSVEFSPLLVSLGMRKWLLQNLYKFDIVHIHGLYRFPPTYAARLARQKNVPYVITPHGSLDPFLYPTSSRSVRLKRIYERLFDLPNLHGASAIHYTADEERERASFLSLRAPSFIVPNGLDWSRYRELPEWGEMRERWGWDMKPLILFLGRIHFKKGLDLLIPAFDALLKKVTEAQLAIVGPENDDFGRKVRDWVRERRLESSVHFVGSLEGRDVVQAYVDADVFVLPSYTENFGMTVAEAMACKLPVVISDQVNIHAEVANAGAGIVTRCDVDEVAQAMESLLLDADRRDEMGEAGRRLVQERYTWPAIVEALTREYETVIERHQSGRDPAHSARRTAS